MNNKPYEISLWDDIIVYTISPKFGADYPVGNAITFTFREEPTERAEVEVFENDNGGWTIIQNSYTLDIESLDNLDEIYPDGWEITSWRTEEKKIGVIGSNTITSQHRAFNGKLVSNVNGQNTLTFSIYQKYYDNQTGELVENPFIKLLTNERKVKLRLGDNDVKWYDFIIKNVQENSDSKVFTFTCTDLFMNELSKVGFSVKLDAELENNIGTVTDLAERVVEMTDWSVIPVGEGSDLIHSFVEEPLYQLKIAGKTGINLKPVVMREGESIYTFTPEVNYELYGFYSAINSKSKTIQVLCKVDSEGKPINVDYDSSWPLDETLGVIASEHIEDSNVRQFVIENVAYKDDGRPDFVDGMNISTNYRGRRIVRSQITKYDANLGKYVSKYIGTEYETGAVDENKEPIKSDVYWCFAASDVDELTVLHNYVTNPKDFTHTKGWEVVAPDNTTNLIKIEFNSTYTSGAKVNEDGSFEVGEEESVNVVRSCITFEVPGIDRDKPIIQKIYNSGLWNYLYDYDKITQGEQFIVRIKQVMDGTGEDNPWGKAFDSGAITPKILFFSTKWLDETDRFFSCEKIESESSKLYDKNYATYRFTCLESLSHEKIISGYLGLCFEFPEQESTRLYAIEELQVFKQIFLKENEEDPTTGQMNYDVVEKESEADKILTPGEYANTPLVMPTYHVYKDGASEKQNLDSMTYDLETKDKTVLEESYVPYFDPYSAARIQVSASESNCFNILQDIAENSQCWIRFNIEHETTGHIKKDGEGNPIKQISFRKYVGKKNYAGFKYGINLKSIQRTVESNQLTTKLIVKPNSNEFAENKQCAIGKAPSNPIKEDFIYNFDYYIKQGMLSSDLIFEDLYGKEGFYTYLKEKNVEVEKKSDQVAYYSVLVSDMEAEVTAYKKLRDEAIQNRTELISDIYSISKYEYNEFIDLVTSGEITVITNEDTDPVTTGIEYTNVKTIQELWNHIKGKSFTSKFEKGSIESWFSQNSIYTKLVEIQTLNAQIINSNMVLYNTQSAPANEEDASIDCLAKQFKLVSEKYEELKQEFKELQKQKQDREREFYTKYSRYIQEGTWNSEDFYDNELYHLEALNVSAISSMPKISYTINVIDVSQIEGLENIDFDLGDQTYMQDVEFFGYVKKSPDSSILTPYSEEIVCTEISRTLDDASQNTIKVQNYKNQFEDLFQRMTAAAQQIQYKAGEYQKAANAFAEDGDIKPTSLQKAFENNKLMLNNATDQSVSWDSTGITAIDLKQPNLQTRIIGGAIMVTNDGDTWQHAITGNGINASLITAGKISVGEVTLETGDQTSFRWDKLGISAYRFFTDGNTIKYDPYTFVRHDSFGLYGISGNENFTATTEESIWNAPEAKFGLTWKGFFLNSDDDGAVRITSDEQIQVFNGRPQKDAEGKYTNQRIKIGAISYKIVDENDGEKEINTYGIQIFDNNQKPVVTQDDEGNISITGKITAGTGEIGGWKIDGTVLYRGKFGELGSAFIGTVPNAISLADSDVRNDWVFGAGKTFGVTTNGELWATGANITGTITATEGQIGAWYLDSFKLWRDCIPSTGSGDPIYGVGMSATSSKNDPAFWAGFNNVNGHPWKVSNWADYTNFYVTQGGEVVAKAGKIGGWTINPTTLSWASGSRKALLAPGSLGIPDNVVFGVTGANGQYTSGFWVGGDGVLHAQGASINGNISSGSTISGSTISGGTITGATGDFSGTVTAKAGSKIGPFSVVSGGITVDSYGEMCFRDNRMIIPGEFSNIQLDGLQTKMVEISSSSTDNTSHADMLFLINSGVLGGFELWHHSTKDGTNKDEGFELIYYEEESNYYKPRFIIQSQNGYHRGTWSTSSGMIGLSDINQKNTINVIEERYDIFFDKILPRTFKYNEGTSDRLHTGFIAQEIKESLDLAEINTKNFAGLIIRNNENGESDWGIRYDEFIPLNTWQIQKLKFRVSELESQLAELTQKFETFSNL